MSKPNIPNTEALFRGDASGGSSPEAIVVMSPTLEEQRFREMGKEPASRAELEEVEKKVELQDRLLSGQFLLG